MTQRKSSERRLATINLGVGLLSLAILGLTAWLISPLQIKGTTITAPIAGFSIFALFYLAAQFSERLTEVISDISAAVLKDGTTMNSDKYQTEIDTAKSEIDQKIKDKAPHAEIDTLLKSILENKTLDHYEGSRRATALWAFSSWIGVLVTSFTVGFFQIIGFGWMPHMWDSFISGVIIGGGSKPLHDFIGYIDKQKS